MSPAIIVGLGNPGPAYAGTRHNMGFSLVDALASQTQVALKSDSRFCAAIAKTSVNGCPVWLVQPLTFMNLSGRAVQSVSHFFKVPAESVLVPGTAKLSLGGGAGGHNGISSILQSLPNTFSRFRLGIGPKQFPEQDLADHVLGKLSLAEQTLFREKLPFYIQGVNTWLGQGLAIAQNLINKKASS